MGQVVSSYCNFLHSLKKAQFHTHTVWKAHPDRLLRALLSPEEAAGASLLQWLYNTLAPFPGVGRAGELLNPAWTHGLGPGLLPLEQLGTHLQALAASRPAQPVSLCIEEL